MEVSQMRCEFCGKEPAQNAMVLPANAAPLMGREPVPEGKWFLNLWLCDGCRKIPWSTRMDTLYERCGHQPHDIRS
jgi:hypothetical protein